MVFTFFLLRVMRIILTPKKVTGCYTTQGTVASPMETDRYPNHVELELEYLRCSSFEVIRDMQDGFGIWKVFSKENHNDSSQVGAKNYYVELY